MAGGGIAVLLAKAKEKVKEKYPSEEMDGESKGDEESESDDPVDLFLEAIGQEPTPTMRKAFKLAAQSCMHDEE